MVGHIHLAKVQIKHGNQLFFAFYFEPGQVIGVRAGFV